MNPQLVPVSSAPEERKARILALSDEFLTVVNTAMNSGEDAGLVLAAILNAYFVSAECFGLLELASDSARANADAILQLHAAGSSGAHARH